MLADLAAVLTEHYDSLLLLMLAGACFVLAGLLGIFVWRRRDVVLGEPDVPTVVEPADTAIQSTVQPQPNYHRSDTITARIPGATPVLTPQLAAVARYLDAETTHAIEGLRVIPSPDLGPVCPTCGGPWHALCPSAPKSGPEETQVVDLCPLTTQDIQIPDDEPTPQYAATPAGDATQDLAGSLARAKERVA